MLETTARVAFIGLFTAIVARKIYKLQKDKTRIGRPILLKFIACGMLVSTHTLIKALLSEPPLWLSMFGDAAQQYGALFGYVATYQALHNKLYYPMLRSKEFLFATVASIVTAVATAISATTTSFVDNEPFPASLAYYVSNAGHYFILLVFCLGTALLYVRSLREHQHPAYLVTRGILTVGFLSMTTALMCVEANLFLSIFITDAFREQLNLGYHMLKLIFGVSLLPILVAQPLLNLISDIMAAYVRRRRRKQSMQLRELHTALTSVAPAVRLRSAPDEDDLLIEIGDAEEHILSHIATHPMTQKEIAAYIHTLRAEHKIIEKPGPYLPPAPKHPIKHSLQIAQYLKQLERT